MNPSLIQEETKPEKLKKETKFFKDVVGVLEELIAERKAETARYEENCKKIQKEIELLKPKFGWFKGSNLSTRCVYDNLKPEDLNKPMGISCPCPRCNPYSM